jgi:NADH dehydrogenase
MNKILVAGGTGVLGRRLVQRLAARGLPVRSLSRTGSLAEFTDRVDVVRGDAHQSANALVEVVRGEVRDPATLEPALRGVDTVVSAVHGFAGSGGVSPASVDRDGNTNLIAAAEHAGASFILMSIVGAAPDHPIDLFRMKYQAEERLRASRVPWTIVRATAFLETWLTLLEQTANGSGRPLIFGRGTNPINFVSVEDVAALLERVIVDPCTRGRVLEIGGPQNLAFNDLAQAFQRAAGRTTSPRHVPRPALHAMALLMRPFNPVLARQAQAALVMDEANFAFDSSPIHAAYPDLPTTALADVLDRGLLAREGVSFARGHSG